jgi:hypothetical protein
MLSPCNAIGVSYTQRAGGASNVHEKLMTGERVMRAPAVDAARRHSRQRLGSATSLMRRSNHAASSSHFGTWRDASHKPAVLI